MFEAFKNIKKESSEVYKSRLKELLLDIAEFLMCVLGTILIIIGYLIGFIVLGMIGIPIVLVVSILEFILVPIPYFILTGEAYYGVTDSLIAKYIDFLDKFSIL